MASPNAKLNAPSAHEQERWGRSIRGDEVENLLITCKFIGLSFLVSNVGLRMPFRQSPNQELNQRLNIYDRLVHGGVPPIIILAGGAWLVIL